MERQITRARYRELFFKANDSFSRQIEEIKNNDFCTKCGICCEIRYTDLSPVEIFKLSQQNEEISKEYIEHFVPYGAQSDFSYDKNNVIDIENNNLQAKFVNKAYVKKILSKSSKPVYFYFCSKKVRNAGKDCKCSKSVLCYDFPHSVTAILPDECGFKKWQELAIDKIQNKISKDILFKLEQIKRYRTRFSCSKTGTCCRIACSEFSYEELLHKAKNGDNFATQFTSIFIPYENVEDVRKVFPEYIELVESSLDEDEKTYFYHCPHVTDDNLCSRYEERPEICKIFPDNPLTILPFDCGFCQWKNEVNDLSMTLYALVEISEFNLKKIENVLN